MTRIPGLPRALLGEKGLYMSLNHYRHGRILHFVLRQFVQA